MRVLIVEDNADIVANIYAYLEPLGYSLDCARDGNEGLRAARERTFDAIVLDLTLPGLDGLEVCRHLRRDRNPTPVLMLTARDTLMDKVGGFDSGADDYLVKPFLLAELDVRLKALVRRARGLHAGAVLSVGTLKFDVETLTLTRDGVRIVLTPVGYKIIEKLMSAAPALVRREDLIYAIWGDQPPDSDSLRTHIHAIRQALDKPFRVPILANVPGFGYRLIDPDVDVSRLA